MTQGDRVRRPDPLGTHHAPERGPLPPQIPPPGRARAGNRACLSLGASFERLRAAHRSLRANGECPLRFRGASSSTCSGSDPMVVLEAVVLTAGFARTYRGRLRSYSRNGGRREGRLSDPVGNVVLALLVVLLLWSLLMIGQMLLGTSWSGFWAQGFVVLGFGLVGFAGFRGKRRGLAREVRISEDGVTLVKFTGTEIVPGFEHNRFEVTHLDAEAASDMGPMCDCTMTGCFACRTDLSWVSQDGHESCTDTSISSMPTSSPWCDSADRRSLLR